MNLRSSIAGLSLTLVGAAAYAASLTLPSVSFTSGSGLKTVFNCSSGFTITPTSATCGVGILGPSGTFQVVGSQNGSSPALSGSSINLAPAGATHVALNLNYDKLVDVQQFSTTFTFVPNGWNVAFILNNSNNNPIFNGKAFSAGAGCEAAFYQGFSQTNPPNNVFAIELDQWSSLSAGGSNFTYSSVQYYDTGHPPPNAPNAPGRSPCNPDFGTPENVPYVGVNKVSTSPVPLNNPSGTINTTTHDTYSATITYDGSNLTINLYDVTKGGSCPGASCFTHTWTNVNIPSIVGANTAWTGLGAGTNAPVSNPLLVNSWSYSSN